MIDEWIEQLVWLIPALPVLAASWNILGYLLGANRGERGEAQTSLVATGAAALSLLFLLGIDVYAIINGVPGQIHVTQWFASGLLEINISFTLDFLSLLIGTIVALITLLTIRFSINYMHREAGFQRFFIILSLFSAAMLLIVLAGNAVLVFVGWELAGVSSYLLIAYSFERPVATENANRAFITNRIGDVGFILGLFFTFAWIGSTEWPTMVSGSDQLTSLQVALLVSGFLIAAFAKSALVPFSPWLSRALEGPTPSSAVFYGSLMVHAGVYFIIRLQPIIEHAEALQVVLVIIGILTAAYGFFCGLVQADVKTAFIFSTTGQIGLMTLACGLGWFELATWHLAAHAVWRAYQFLHAPSFIELIHQPARPVPAWLQRNRKLYIASLQRFWLDNLANGLLARPTTNLAREVEMFDARVVNRIVGLPSHVGAASSLAEWEERKHGYVSVPEGGITKVQGVLGNLLEWVASVLHWFEEQLVLKGSGEGLLRTIRILGRYLLTIEYLLSQPRYLWLLILITFVVII